jgi:hypothetical protein
MTDTGYHLQRGRLTALHQRFNVGAWLLEYNSIGGPNLEELQRAGLPVIAFNTTNATKMHIIDQLALAFERKAITIPNDPVLVGELQAFESSRTATGLVRYSAPEGMHDDGVMALALAWHAAQNRVTTFDNPFYD